MQVDLKKKCREVSPLPVLHLVIFSQGLSSLTAQTDLILISNVLAKVNFKAQRGMAVAIGFLVSQQLQDLK